MTKLDFIATAEQTGERIDRFLSAQDTGLTRSAVQKLIEDGGVTVGGKNVAKNYKLHNGAVSYTHLTLPTICSV